jgi:molecular chaperone HtpG
MSREQVVENLGTIARSGTKAFLENLRQAEAKDRPELIGQFGVGFYASFMVADRVTVVTKPAGGGEAVRWESDGQGEYSVSPADRPEGRGTDVTLHLREDAPSSCPPGGSARPSSGTPTSSSTRSCWPRQRRRSAKPPTTARPR